MSVREVTEGLQVQGAQETVTYSIETINWGGAPSDPSMTVVRISDGVDVTDDVTSGSMNTNTDASLIFTKQITALTAGELYRVDVQFTITGFEPAECYFYIKAED